MRIISGKHRGLVLYTFDSENIRPTADRVKEGVFNKLHFEISGAKVLDLFGGTGAISLEFLSRGAERVVTVDNNKNSISLIKKNFSKAKEQVNLITDEYYNALSRLKNEKFDIVFVDPPFATDFGEKAIEIISKLNLLEFDGVIVYEHLVDKVFKIPDIFKIVDQKKYGTIMVSYLEHKND